MSSGLCSGSYGWDAKLSPSFIFMKAHSPRALDYTEDVRVGGGSTSEQSPFSLPKPSPSPCSSFPSFSPSCFLSPHLLCHPFQKQNPHILKELHHPLTSWYMATSSPMESQGKAFSSLGGILKPNVKIFFCFLL